MLKIIALGRLTKDLELLTITNDKQSTVANFTLACRDNKETEFIQCTVWNEMARTIKENTKKGSLLYIEGRYKTKEYVDESTQIKHKRIFINVESFEFLEKKPHEETLEDRFLLQEQKDVHQWMKSNHLSIEKLQELVDNQKNK